MGLNNAKLNTKDGEDNGGSGTQPEVREEDGNPSRSSEGVQSGGQGDRNPSQEEVIALLVAEINRSNRELKMIRENLLKVINYIHDAESEIPERLRRFMNYMHDLHDIKYMYEELGHKVPGHHLREMERCDDRYRQILEEMHAAGAPLEKIRREMAQDTENRWDHTRQLEFKKS